MRYFMKSCSPVVEGLQEVADWLDLHRVQAVIVPGRLEFTVDGNGIVWDEGFVFEIDFAMLYRLTRNL